MVKNYKIKSKSRKHKHSKKSKRHQKYKTIKRFCGGAVENKSKTVSQLLNELNIINNGDITPDLMNYTYSYTNLRTHDKVDDNDVPMMKKLHEILDNRVKSYTDANGNTINENPDLDKFNQKIDLTGSYALTGAWGY